MEYLGDQYLLLNDIMELGDDPIMKAVRYAGLGIMNAKYMAYENGSKDHLIRTTAFHIGINKVLKGDTPKYTKIWRGEDPRYPQERKIKITIDDMMHANDVEEETKTDIYN